MYRAVEYFEEKPPKKISILNSLHVNVIGLNVFIVTLNFLGHKIQKSKCCFIQKI